jgi:mycothione reductase
LQEKFDLIVIGSGSGLDVANAAATHHGLKVAIIEKDKMGGTCLNTGCIPSKLLIHSADVAKVIKHADIFGIKVDGFSVDFEKIVERVNTITDSNSMAIKKSYENSDNPKLFAKECRFVGKKMISLGRTNMSDEEIIITAENILIASGTRPKIPKIKGLLESGYITSNESLRLKQQPRTLTFIGGGYITCELAHFYGSLGTEINIIQIKEVLIPKEDKEISHKFTEIFSKKYNVYLGYDVESVSKGESNTFHIVAKNKSSGKILELNSEKLLVAVGRVPNSDSLDIKKTGVMLDENGFILVDQYLETNIKGIFALGDVVGRYQFKHNANNEARYAYHNMLVPDIKKLPVDYTAMPHAIFSSPQVAGVGFTEQQLIIKGIDYQKSIYPYIRTAMGEAIQDRDGFVKFLVDKNDKKILGCHIIGTDASTLIHEVLVAMKAGDGTVDSITRTIHIHPALSEVIARAAEAINT